MKFYKIAIISQGYVGLPLALEFAKYFSVLGFDITGESDSEKLVENLSIYKISQGEKGSKTTNELAEISDSNVFIVNVPTPIDQYNSPNLKPLMSASDMLRGIIKRGDIIIYESTAYSGCTAEECVPVLEKFSSLKFNKYFFVGYSSERINPGDKINTLTSVIKVSSASTPEVAVKVNNLYKKIITPRTHIALSIKAAVA